MIEATFFIEVHSNLREVTRSSLERMIEKLESEEAGVEVLDVEFDEILEEEGTFSQTVEVDLRFGSLQDYLMTAIRYGPSAIEVTHPEEVVLSAEEFARLLGEIVKFAKTFYLRFHLGYQLASGRGKGIEAVGLSEEEIEGLISQGAIHAKIVVEREASSRRKAIDDFVYAIQDEVFVEKVKTKKTGGKKGFQGLVGLKVYLYEPKTLVGLSARHTPVLIEILEPSEIRLGMLDLQDIGVDLAGIFFEATHRLAMGSMGKISPSS
jgi:hypothetical protein